jgi:hypothetical protein
MCGRWSSGNPRPGAHGEGRRVDAGGDEASSGAGQVGPGLVRRTTGLAQARSTREEVLH